MVEEPTSALEDAIRTALAAGDKPHALHLAVTGYSTELLSFLGATHRGKEEAAEVFAQTCEDLVRSLDQFRGECSVRTWLYALARNASRRHFADPYQRRAASLSEAPELEQYVRTVTATFLRTEWKHRLRVLRDALDPDDRALLVLRVDRQMSWNDIARILGEEPTSTATLRKRFERIKAALRDEAHHAGWFPRSES